jgi:hypothetical protein
MLDKNSFAQELVEPMNKQLSVLNSRNKIINAGRTT